MQGKEKKIFFIIICIIFFPITLVCLLIKSLCGENSNEKSFILGETDKTNFTDIDMDIMDDD